MKTKIKQFLITFLGQEISTWIHAVRFYYLVKTQSYYEIEIELLNKLNLANKVAIDIGANSANWTIPMANSVGVSGKIFAFEADPYYALATQKTIKLFDKKNVFFFSFGLSDKQETLALKIFDNGKRVSGTSRFVEKNVPFDVVSVPVIPLDNLIDKYPELLKTSFIKCDVEGFESRVFNGAKKIIETARPIVVSEMNPESKKNVSNVFGFFKSLDYQAFVVVSSNRIRLSNQSGRISEGERVNRIFFPKEYSIPKSIIVE